MSVQNLFTSQTQIHTQTQSAGTGTLGAAGLSVRGLEFLELLMSRISETSGNANKKGEVQNTFLQSKNSTVKIAELLTGTAETGQNIQTASADMNTELSKALALNQKALDNLLSPLDNEQITTKNSEIAPLLPRELLSHLPNGIALPKDTIKTIEDKLSTLENLISKIKAALIQAQDTVTNEISGTDLTSGETINNETKESKLNFATALAQLEQAANKIQKALDLSENGQAVIAPFTPGQITELQQRLRNIQDELKALRNNYRMSEAVKGQNLQALQKIQAGLATSGRMPETALTSRLDGYAKTGDGDARTSGGLPEPDIDGETFTKLMKEAGGKKTMAGDVNIKNIANTSRVTLTTQNTPGALGALQGWPFSIEGSLFTPTEGISSFSDEFAISGQSGPAITGAGSLTNLVTQAYSASRPHPGTQAVMATIQKGAASGENKSITLKLDPPELGRVEVRMHFGKNNSLKTTILTEKPETHMMMQRDVQLLERALLDSGLDVDGSSINFELADDGHNFGQDAKHDGARNQAQSPDEDEDYQKIIETTMNWHVDPETGHMHYNILA